MCIADSRATTKKSEKSGMTDMVRKEKKRNHLIYSCKPTKGRKRMEDENRNKE